MAFAIGLAAGPALADEPGGRITGNIGDRPVTVEVWRAQSDAYGDAERGGVSIYTRHIAPDNGLGRLSLGFEGTFTEPFNIELSIAGVGNDPKPHINGYWEADEDALTLSIARSEVRDNLLAISGTVSGDLVFRPQADRNTPVAAPGDSLSVTLDFDARLEVY
ncbi:hypothetical protein [Microbaculum sp. FT89]|uniref:hypothetical protein n=1 Tax=Microbaculum sp. FT89 TaxID=3447298 RepID=UPI003F53247F